MRFLFLILVVAPVLGTELHSHIRVRRQYGNVQGLNQAPAAIKQILASQQARDPIVNLPPQQVPNLLPSKPIEPQLLSQSQLSQYQPKVQVGQAPQQPSYKQITVRPSPYNPPQYRPNYAQPQQQSQPQLQPQPQHQPQARAQPQLQQLVTQEIPEPTYQYSKNLPPQLQQLVQLQLNLANALPQHQG
jgi:hypothetical protein